MSMNIWKNLIKAENRARNLQIYKKILLKFTLLTFRAHITRYQAFTFTTFVLLYQAFMNGVLMVSEKPILSTDDAPQEKKCMNECVTALKVSC